MNRINLLALKSSSSLLKGACICLVFCSVCQGQESPSCSIKTLPVDKQAQADKQAVEVNPANSPSTSGGFLTVIVDKKWKPGTKLTVGFLDSPSSELKNRILSHMNAWGKYANIEFIESSSNPQIRISRTAEKPNNGYWSYLGTDILQVPSNEPTMNLENFSMDTPESEFVRVIRHETGHTLGFPHEHMRQEIVNRIDREKAIAYFAGYPNYWTEKETIGNVLTSLNMSSLDATAQADSNSIMCYWLPASIMKDGVEVKGGTDINPQDAKFAAKVYPYTPQCQDKRARNNGLYEKCKYGHFFGHANQAPGVIYVWPSPWNSEDYVWCHIPNHDMLLYGLNISGGDIQYTGHQEGIGRYNAKYWSQDCDNSVFRQFNQ